MSDQPAGNSKTKKKFWCIFRSTRNGRCHDFHTATKFLFSAFCYLTTRKTVVLSWLGTESYSAHSFMSQLILPLSTHKWKILKAKRVTSYKLESQHRHEPTELSPPKAQKLKTFKSHGKKKSSSPAECQVTSSVWNMHSSLDLKKLGLRNRIAKRHLKTRKLQIMENFGVLIRQMSRTNWQISYTCLGSSQGWRWE